MRISPLVLVPGVLALASTAHADRRAFVHTYEYMTIAGGDVELEVWNTQSRAGFGDDSGTSFFDLQLEIEYGITDHWDIALYQVIAQTDGPTPMESEGLHFSETKLETRYRFAERGELPVDTVAYFEIAKGFGETHWEFEPKIILARDFGRASVALNLIPELELEEEVDAMGETELELEFEPGWALGATYELMPALKLGGETFGSLSSPGNNNDLFWWIGPSVGWAPSPKLWVAATAAVGLTDNSDDLLVRFIVGLGI